MTDNSLNDLPDSLEKDPHFLYALADVRLRMRWVGELHDMFSAAVGTNHKRNLQK